MISKERMLGVIEKSERDIIQPYRVWFRGHIIYFARTELEAMEKLQEAKTRGEEKPWDK